MAVTVFATITGFTDTGDGTEVPVACVAAYSAVAVSDDGTSGFGGNPPATQGAQVPVHPGDDLTALQGRVTEDLTAAFGLAAGTSVIFT